MFTSDKQLDILRHALGWPKNYRNHYNSGPGCDTYEDCEHLVKAGLMRKYVRDWIPDAMYAVTQDGIQVLKMMDKLKAKNEL